MLRSRLACCWLEASWRLAPFASPSLTWNSVLMGGRLGSLEKRSLNETGFGGAGGWASSTPFPRLASSSSCVLLSTTKRRAVEDISSRASLRVVYTRNAVVYAQFRLIASRVECKVCCKSWIRKIRKFSIFAQKSMQSVVVSHKNYKPCTPITFSRKSAAALNFQQSGHCDIHCSHIFSKQKLPGAGPEDRRLEVPSPGTQRPTGTDSSCCSCCSSC